MRLAIASATIAMTASPEKLTLLQPALPGQTSVMPTRVPANMASHAKRLHAA
ncbi:MAG TPA: hypothetical protein VN028_02465 [Rhodocyclaceae bacterium]|nr:hypothetical protein [Rhodocyclaceae bacterium]